MTQIFWKSTIKLRPLTRLSLTVINVKQSTSSGVDPTYFNKNKPISRRKLLSDKKFQTKSTDKACFYLSFEDAAPRNLHTSLISVLCSTGMFCCMLHRNVLLTSLSLCYTGIFLYNSVLFKCNNKFKKK